MTKMDMVWVAVALLLHPTTEANVFVEKSEIDSQIMELFGEIVTPVMINRHLVNSEDRQADRTNPSRGGSRNRYLVRDLDNGFRLYKQRDSENDAWDKTGPTHPQPNNIEPKYRYLVTWYNRRYIHA